MKIIFMGTPQFAVPSLEILLKNGYDIPLVVTVPDKQAGRGLHLKHSEIKEFAFANNLNISQPEFLKDEIFIKEIESIKPDLIVVVAFRILPKEIFLIPESGTINLHASLLPKYRGAAPINWALINGEKQTGVTTFFIEEKVDTGNLLLQRKTNIEESDDYGILYEKLSLLGAETLLDTVKQIESKQITPLKQDNSLATPAPKILKEHCRINWATESYKIHNLIRGLSPHPSAYTTLDNKLVKIFSSKLTDKQTIDAPGKLTVEKKSLLVSAKDYFLEISELQLEGKKRIKASEFINSLKKEDNKLFV